MIRTDSTAASATRLAAQASHRHSVARNNIGAIRYAVTTSRRRLVSPCTFTRKRANSKTSRDSLTVTLDPSGDYMLLVRAESDRSHEGWLCGQSATCFVKQRLLAGQGGTVSNEVGNSAAH